jgi:hypothetical protein
MLVLLAGTLSIGWWVVQSARVGSEEQRFKQAMELYEKGEYDDARAAFQKLHADFPASHDARKYRFLAELAGVRDEAESARDLASLKPALDHVLQFVSFNQKESLLADRNADVWRMLHQIAFRSIDEAEKQHDPAALKWAQTAWTEAEKLQPPTNVNAPEEQQKLTKAIARVEQALAVHTRRLAVVGAIRKVVAHASAAGVKEARALASAAGLNDDAEVAALLAQLVNAHREAIRFEPASAASAIMADEDTLASILLAPALVKGKPNGERPAPALALARGVLYALDPVTGDVRWARRVGIDSTNLPLRVPPDPITPELLLVVSSDDNTVSALIADTGAMVWRHRLAAPGTGQPVLVGRSLFVPLLSGQVDEVEISGGRLLGSYQLGQRLAVGGALQPETSLVYFPADDFCVYVLDVAKRTCAAVLYSNHPAGSLRGVPLFVRGPKAASAETGAKLPTGWMLLCQAKGTEAAEIRAFELPITDADRPASGPPLQMPGLAWFPPWHDSEKLALVTDAGLLSVWGIRQPGNREDPLLFPLFGPPLSIVESAGRGRAQVVHAEAQSYWALAGGQLHRLDAEFRADSGPALTRARSWPASPSLGTPLHAGQSLRSLAGKPTLLLTTLTGGGSALCSAVDAELGKEPRWQRQLGGVAIQPLAQAGSRVLLRDPGGLFLLDPTQFGDKTMPAWSTVDSFHVPEPLSPDDQVVLLTDGDDFVQLTWSGGAAGKLRVRRLPVTGESSSKTVLLPAPISGTMALSGGTLLLLLADGVAARLDLGGEGIAVAGPQWRAPGAEERAWGHIVALGGDEFLLTDGSRSLSRFHWPSAKIHERRVRTELSHRIVSAPAVVATAKGAAPLVCVADASDTLTLLEGERLKVVRRWQLPGKITAGPLPRDRGILCIVDHKRLIWIDPEQPEPKWEYSLVAAAVGAPPLVEGALITAEVSGRFLALDPATGNPLGPGYMLKANVAPDAGPVPFGPGRVLVPLNDGTLVVVPLDRLR